MTLPMLAYTIDQSVTYCNSNLSHQNESLQPFTVKTRQVCSFSFSPDETDSRGCQKRQYVNSQLNDNT